MDSQNDQTIARRTFLTQVAEWGTAGVAGVVATQGSTALAAPAAGGINLGTATAADFARLRGSKFQVQLPKGPPVDVTLVETRGLHSGYQGKPPQGAKRRPAFGVVFQSVKPVNLPSATYTVKHAQLGSFSLFLGPVSHPKKGYLEAVFG